MFCRNWNLLKLQFNNYLTVLKYDIAPVVTQGNEMKLLRKTRIDSNNPKGKNKNFHKSIRFIIILGQLFGIMPVQGVTGPSHHSLKFTWKSLRVAYSLLAITGAAVLAYAPLYICVTRSFNIGLFTAIIFFGSGGVVRILFIKLAKNWPKLMTKWHDMDVAMITYGWPPRLNLELKLFSGVVLTFALAEHTIAVINSIRMSEKGRSKDDDVFEHFFVKIAYSQVFEMLTYRVWAGFILQAINLICTFSWTYIDLFIILMSTSLALRFRQVTDRIELYIKRRVSDEVLWKNVREDYNRISKLCQEMNEELSSAVIMSFGNNLYFILVQFFHSLNKMEDMLEKVYFSFSFGFLIGRTVCVSIYGAWIHDESQSPLPLLNSVSSPIYNSEIKRFIFQMRFDPVSLSGKQFFNVTRGLILSIAGTIMTYELVLLQFKGILSQLHLSKSSNSTLQ